MIFCCGNCARLHPREVHLVLVLLVMNEFCMKFLMWHFLSRKPRNVQQTTAEADLEWGECLKYLSEAGSV